MSATVVNGEGVILQAPSFDAPLTVKAQRAPEPKIDAELIAELARKNRELSEALAEERAKTGTTNGHDKSANASKILTADFFAYMPEHRYIFVPSRDLWPASSVNARCEPPTHADGAPVTKPVKRTGKHGADVLVDVPMSATEWLDEHQPIDQMTWAPGAPMVVRDKLVSNGGWLDRPGCAVFNLYIPPQIQPGNPDDVSMWINHVRKIYPTDADHIIKWLAHRVQRPGEKINHALVLGGGMGIGKDTILEPVKYAVGPWNFSEVAPAHLLGRFNGFVKSVILRISEARDLGDVDRFAFYDHMKVYTAAPPDVLRCDEKNIREHSVMNVCGVIITSNHKTDGIYLPADDRRNYVAWSDLAKENFTPDYWNDLYAWFRHGGSANVAAYLAGVDLSDFDPKAPPRKTAAFYDIVDANRAPEDAELADALELLDNPPAVKLIDIVIHASEQFKAWIEDRKNRRQIPHRLESVGYVPVRNDSAKDGLWVIGGRRQTIYAKHELSVRDKYVAASELANQGRA